MAKEEKKQRRIQGDAFWKLMAKLKKIKKAQEELVEWQQAKAEEAGVYTDLINWNTGAIFSDTAEIVNGSIRNGQIVGRIDREIIAEHREKIKQLNGIDAELGEYRDQLAKQLHVWPDQIDIKTGKIDPEEFDGEDIKGE